MATKISHKVYEYRPPQSPPPYLGNIPKKKLSASLKGAQKRTFHGLSDRKRLPAPLPLTVSFS